MDDTYYFSINNEKAGPFNPDGIGERIAQGAITQETLAWRKGMSDWQPAGQITELSEFFTESPSQDEPPPLPGEKAKANAAAENTESAEPADLSPFEAKAYRLVLALYRKCCGFTPPIRKFVLRNPKRAVPVAIVTIGLLLAVLISLPFVLNTPADQPTLGKPQVQKVIPPPNLQKNYRQLPTR